MENGLKKRDSIYQEGIESPFLSRKMCVLISAASRAGFGHV